MKLRTALLLVIVLAINIFFRLEPAFLNFTKEKAAISVDNQLYEEAKKEIDEKFKRLPQEIKFKLIQDQLNVWYKQKKAHISGLIRKESEELKKDYQDEKGQVFLLELDPYHWLRLTRNLVQSGRIGDKTLEGQEYDSYMLAPVGMKAEVSLHKNLHVYIAAWIFKFCRFFYKGLSLEKTVFFIPVVISVLVIAALFFLCRQISVGNVAGFFACLSLGLAPIFLNRSMAGWFDTDTYVILFSILILWGIVSSLKDDRSIGKNLLFVVFAGLCTGLFSFTWDGWWYIFDMIIIASLCYLLNLQLLKNELQTAKFIKREILCILTFFVSGLFFVVLFSGIKVSANFFQGPLNAFSALKEGFWPNTFLTVSELSGSSPSAIVKYIGGEIMLILAAVSIFLLLMDKSREGFTERNFIGILFALWLIIMYLVALKAHRFSMLMVLPISISFGLITEKAFQLLDNVIKGIVKADWQRKGILLGLSLVITSLFIQNALFAKNTSPLMTKEWWDLLNQIRLESPKGTIINSWWDFGHWFKAVADRPVIFDGATQNTPIAYWMGRVFITSDEKEAMGILRMLNSASNKAFEELSGLGFKPQDCISILNRLTKIEDLQEADKFLSSRIPDNGERNKILQYSFKPQAPVYFIVESSLMPKMRSISFLGGWDFQKADIYRTSRALNKESMISYAVKTYNYSDKDAEDLYNTAALISRQDALDWISPRLNFYFPSRTYKKEGNTFLFDNGYTVDIVRNCVNFYNRVTGKWQVPKSLFFTAENEIKEVVFENSDMRSSVLLLRENGNYELVVLDPELARSMVVRLYYFKGKGFKYFKLLYEKELPDKGRILVFKVSWDGK